MPLWCADKEQMHKLFTILTLLIVPLATPAQTEFRVFQDQQGREMEAQVTAFRNETVYIQRKDGLRTQVAITLFSQKDQDYVRNWAAQNAVSEGALSIRFSAKEGNEKEDGEEGLDVTRYEAHYEVILKNSAQHAIKDLRIEYLMMKFEDAVISKKRSAGESLRQKGSIEVPVIRPHEELRLNTKPFPMMRTKLKPGYVWDLNEAGFDRESEDELKGIWAKIYMGDKLVYEASRPSNMKTKEVW